jgi:glycogen debranching enzyme
MTPPRQSPRRESLEVIGRAGPVSIGGAPYVPAAAREELLVVKEGDVFLCTRPDGDVHPSRLTGEGLYAGDTRHLSELRLELDGTRAVALSYSDTAGHTATVDATNTTLEHGDGRALRQQSLQVQRLMVVRGRLFHLLRLRSFLPGPVGLTVTLTVAADFADVFEVRGVRLRDARGHRLAANRTDRGVTLAYMGEDGELRESIVEFDPAPAAIDLEGDRATARWPVALRQGRVTTLLTTVEPVSGGRRRQRTTLRAAEQQLAREDVAWRTACTRLVTSNELFDRFLEMSRRDVRLLTTPTPDGGRVVAAGVPWYVAPFGRDSLITALESLLLNPGLARSTLIVLARMQAHTDDPWRDAEPGKILHELRSGELASAGLIPHTPYYGTADATPLFLVLAAAYHAWTDDRQLLAALRPAFDAALTWIDQHGDSDGDGFVEYRRRSPGGLANQGWKDSDDAVMHADGRLADGPIALVEVQAYVYLAKTGIADVYEALGDRDVALRLRAEAATLRRHFNEAFWDADEGSYALALDGRKRQVRSVTSNPGHALFCGIADPAKARRVAERLMAPDMFTGWGVRTLSAESPAYNPMSYHNGSVWPHDNAIVAAGLERYGLGEEAARIATALFDVASTAHDSRLPELFCGFDRLPAAPVVAYPVACVPQAWATAVPFLVIQTLLGIRPRAPLNELTVTRPHLPAWLDRVELHGLAVGGSRISLAFERTPALAALSLLSREGDLRVTIGDGAADERVGAPGSPRRGDAGTGPAASP